jgi:guanylate kinase
MSLKLPNKTAGSLYVLSGPSGVGKTTLRKALLKKNSGLRFSVSWTTRARRSGEKAGKDYRFVSKKAFEEKKEARAFLEWARVHQEYYGTPRSPIEGWIAKGEDVILDIDIQGARQVKKRIRQAVTIFVLPPSTRELRNRLVKRETEPAAELVLRLKNAEKEMQSWRAFDFVVVNKEIRTSVEALEAIIRAGRFRVRV